ncbi:hypothetical protein D3C85_1804520 [compost metagenome]
MLLGNFGGKGHGQLVLPLPGVHRHQEIPGRVQAQRAKLSVEVGKGPRPQLGVQVRGVVQPVA